ncbi:hypothetical protein DFJ67_7340 [Asanoa ferruginea]|uniref:Uncharacterized protein n=1 Tax=Asanoa ferruginea TaxID=53367 RepID=A0A3D9ZW74_9ACTN|nr:hypothetical protein [Asanoa ferruginea]REG01260.1 hypothetical protein DFJ67_7340 [Asanoa ferruginea]GIF51446.1 hypothetical protein Afe04nite_59850 [Asanoa ferruginea]
MDGWVLALAVLAVVVGGTVVVIGRRRAAARTAADPRSAARAAIRGMAHEQRKTAKGTMRGKGTGPGGADTSWSWGTGSSCGGGLP